MQTDVTGSMSGCNCDSNSVVAGQRKEMKSIMNKRLRKSSWCILLAMVFMLVCGINALAAEDDNSLSSLGILTEGAEVSPEFSYDTWEYTVTVPAGTTELSLDPVPSSSSATISDISGTTLTGDGTDYVSITVQAANGTQFVYGLHVEVDGDAAAAAPVAETEAQTETETETEKETEAETEDSQYVRVDKNSLQEAENTITSLKGEITNYKGRVSLFTKIMYGLIALCVILLFVVINLLLRKRDLKAELNDYRSYGYSESKKGQKAQQKMERRQQKSDKKQKKAMDAAAPAADPEIYRQPVSPLVKPAAMQTGNPAQPQQMYPGLDVQPQKSQKKSKQMPQYEQTVSPVYAQPQPPVNPAGQPVAHPAAPQPSMSQPAPASQPIPAPQPTKGKKPTGKGKGKNADVEINMIDL